MEMAQRHMYSGTGSTNQGDTIIIHCSSSSSSSRSMRILPARNGNKKKKVTSNVIQFIEWGEDEGGDSTFAYYHNYYTTADIRRENPATNPNFMVMFEHDRVYCPYCKAYDNPDIIPTVNGVNQHIREAHKAELRKGEFQYRRMRLSWNESIYATYETCSWCGQWLHLMYEGHYTTARSCWRKEGGPTRWVVNAMYPKTGSRIRDRMISYAEMCRSVLPRAVVTLVEGVVNDKKAVWRDFRKAAKGDEDGHFQKLYLSVDLQLERIYVGETVQDLYERMQGHVSDGRRGKNVELGAMMASKEYLFCVVGVLEKTSNRKQEKAEILALERALRDALIAEGTFTVLND